MYLFDEQPILANKTLARELGLNEALILQQINFGLSTLNQTIFLRVFLLNSTGVR